MVRLFSWYFWLIFISANCSYKPDFNFCNSFPFSWVDKVTQQNTKVCICYFKSCYSVPFKKIMQLSDQVKIKLISQLIKGISRVLQNLLKYFKSTPIFRFLILSLSVLSINLDLNLNDTDSVIAAWLAYLWLINDDFFLQNWYRLP